MERSSLRLLFAWRFLMGDKIYSSRELKERYKVKILGKLSSGKKVGAIDAWLNRLEGRAAMSMRRWSIS